MRHINFNRVVKAALLFFGTVFSTAAFGQVDVVASAGTPAASYTTLKGAFDAINAGTHQGVISVGLSGDVTETASAVLFASGTGPSVYTTVAITPTGGAVRTISGSLAAPLIDLDGADNVTFDGLNTGGNGLIISNTNAAATAGTSTIRFVNDATLNTITNCTVLGASTGAPSQNAGTASAVTATILFAGSTGATGNDNNTISNSTISDATTQPTVAIGSAGQSAALSNDNITVSGNNIANFYGLAGANGIDVASNSSAWSITGNKFYQTAARTGLASTNYLECIYVNTTAGGGYTVNNNVIGFANAAGTGMLTNNGGRFVGIDLAAVAATPVSNIQGNTINGINWTTASGAAVAGAAVMNVIIVKAGGVNIGNTTANTIGSTTGVGSATSGIFVTSSSLGTGIYGIYMTSANGGLIQNNTVGAIATSGTPAIGFGFAGIQVAGAGSYTIQNNTIGNSTASSIQIGQAGTTAIGAASGIICQATGTTINIGGTAGTGNLIQNMTLVSNSGTSAMLGISATGAAGTLNANYNTVRGLTTATGSVTGISNTGAVVTAINLTNNSLGDATAGFVTYSAANSSTLNAISNSNTGGAVGSTLNILNNDIRGIVHSVAGSTAHNYIINTGPNPTTNLNNNTFTNLNVNTTGSVTFIGNSVTHAPGTTHNVNNNSVVTAYVKGGSGGTVYFYNSYGASLASVTEINTGNNFSNLTFTGATIIGWRSADGPAAAPMGPRKTVTGNTFSNITNNTSGTIQLMYVGFSDNTFSNSNVANNTFSNINGTSTIVGLFSDAGNQNFTSNTLSGFTSTAGNVLGLQINGSTSQNVNLNTMTNFTTAAAAGQVTGVLVSAGTLTSVTGNTISGLSGSGAGSQLVGVFISAGTTANVSANTISGFSSISAAPLFAGIATIGGTTANIFNNKIYGLSASAAFTGTGLLNGILLQGGTTNNVYNNIIGQITAPAANSTDAIRGISVTSTAVTSTNTVTFNTVYLNASSTGTNFGTSGIFHTVNATATTAALDLRNNIIVNESVSSGTGLSVAYRRSGVALNNYAAASNRNDFFAPVIFNDGTNTDLTLGAYQTRVAARDANSISTSPVFLSNVGANVNFLHINTAFPTTIESGGANVGGITADFDGNTRQGNGGYVGTGTAPDIGADEFELAVVNCAAANGGTISPASAAICAGSTRTMTSTGATFENGITYQWKVSSTAGGPYVNVTGGSGATTASYTTGAMTAGTYYYVMEATCSFGPVTGLSTEFTLVVNALPPVSVTPNTATYCVPGPGVGLTASGALTYGWSPAAGLSATTGANVTATPSANTTYTVTGTDINGCIATATAVISVSNNPTIASVTATPATICEGSNSQLAATGNITYNNTVAAYSFAGSSGTYTPVAGGTTIAAVGDDYATGNLPIGFSFNYNGAPQTVFALASNGFIELGSTLTYTSNPAWTPSTNNLVGRANIIAPIWDDNNTTGATVSYITTGSAPNRVLTVQWTGMHVGGNGAAGNPTIDCQVQLFETTNEIKFNYGTSAVFTSTSATIGISGAVGNYLSVTPLAPASASTVSSTVENNAISASTNFPSGTIYTFTPPVAPTLTYAWTPATFLSSTTISNPVATAVMTPTTYTVTVTTPSGCSATGNVAVALNPLPTAPTATNSAQCGTQVPTASVTSTTGAPTPTFNWYDAASAGTLVQSSTSTTYTSNVATTTTFYVSELSALGCESARTPVTVTVAAADPILASVDNATICIGSSINLSVANTASSPAQTYTYTWTGTAGSGLTSQNGTPITITPTLPGTYTYSVSGVDGLCNGFSSVNVTVNPFTSVVTPINVSCNGVNNGSFAQGAVSCGTAASYSVDGGSFGPIPTNLVAGTYSIVTMNTDGFTSAPQSITIGTNVAPTVSISGSATPVCPGTPVPLTVSSSNDPNYTYTWDNGLGSGASVSPAPMVNTTYTVTGTDMSGGANNDCIATATFTITVNPVPTGVTASASDNSICNGQAVTLTSGPSSTPVPLMTQNFDAGLGAWTTTYSGTAPATTAWIVQNSPYTIDGTMDFTNFTTPQGGKFAMSNSDLGSSGLRTRATLVSPSFSTVGMTGASLTFENLYQRFASGDSAVAVQVSINGGSTWTNLKEYFALGVNQGTVTNNAQVMVNENIALGAGLMNQPDVKIRFNYVSSWGFYWLIDNIQLVGTPAPLTYAWTSAPAGYASSSQNPVAPVSPSVTTTYTMTATNAFGCSASASTTVTVNQPSTSSTSAVACGSYTWAENGTTYNTSGAYTTVLAGANANGCDSTITLNLTINQPTSSTVTAVACGSYTWAENGTTYNTSGSYPVVLAGANANGCDSTVTLVLTINQPTSSTVTVAACSSYTWAENGTTYNTSGSYSVVLAGANANGCDSTVTLVLTISQPTSSTVTEVACGSYTWAENGTTYNTSGSYSVVLAGANANGCDSTVTLILTINQPTSSTVTEVACGSYTWAENGTTYNTSGSYPVVLAGANANGCDSTVTLVLTINQPTSSTVTEVACGSYTWAENGTTYTTSGSYPVVLAGANANGCDSTVTLVLTINQPTSSTVTASACTSYTWAENGTTYTTSGSYPVVIAGGNANGCDSTVTLVLTITGNPTATATDNGDASITASTGTAYQWINCATNTAIAGATSQTYTATANGDYAVVVTVAGGCSDTSDCVTIDYIGLTEITDASIQVFPNPTNSDVTIIMTAAEATVEVVDAQGKLLQAVTVGNGEKVNLSTYETGVYFLRIRTVNGSTLERVVKQ